MTVYVLPNLIRPNAAVVAKRAVEILFQYGCSVIMDVAAKEICNFEGVRYASPQECCRFADTIVTIGGDGTILHTAHQVQPYHKPILGVNVGRCGFLTTCEPSQMEEKFLRMTKRDYLLDTRHMLCASICDEGVCREEFALNDIVISNGKLMHTVDFAIYCDDIPVQKYRGDGVIVATPTGSTAYSMSAGGPILDAHASAFVLTPKCPHSLQSSAMVFSSNRKLQIHVGEADPTEVFISCDGHKAVPLHNGAYIKVTLSEKHIDLIAFSTTDQFEAVDKKLRSRD